MFGSINEEKQRGIVPRASNHIFTKIKSDEIEVEYVITCSMLEIYKENLNDLLSNSKQ